MSINPLHWCTDMSVDTWWIDALFTPFPLWTLYPEVTFNPLGMGQEVTINPLVLGPEVNVPSCFPVSCCDKFIVTKKGHAHIRTYRGVPFCF